MVFHFRTYLKENARAKGPAGPRLVLAPRVEGAPVVVAPPPVPPEAVVGAPVPLRASEVDGCGGGDRSGGAAAHAAFAAFEEAGCGTLGDGDVTCHQKPIAMEGLVHVVFDRGDMAKVLWV